MRIWKRAEWSLVGFAAAVQLGIPEDFGLPVAGAGLIIALILEKYRNGRGGLVAMKPRVA